MEELVKARIDKVLVNTEWLEGLHDIFLDYGYPMGSEHCPVIMAMTRLKKRVARDFKFEEKWIEEEGCEETIS